MAGHRVTTQQWSGFEVHQALVLIHKMKPWRCKGTAKLLICKEAHLRCARLLRRAAVVETQEVIAINQDPLEWQAIKCGSRDLKRYALVACSLLPLLTMPGAVPPLTPAARPLHYLASACPHTFPVHVATHKTARAPSETSCQARPSADCALAARTWYRTRVGTLLLHQRTASHK